MKKKVIKAPSKKQVVITTDEAAGMFKDKIKTNATEGDYERAVGEAIADKYKTSK